MGKECVLSGTLGSLPLMDNHSGVTSGFTVSMPLDLAVGANPKPYALEAHAQPSADHALLLEKESMGHCAYLVPVDPLAHLDQALDAQHLRIPYPNDSKLNLRSLSEPLSLVWPSRSDHIPS